MCVGLILRYVRCFVSLSFISFIVKYIAVVGSGSVFLIPGICILRRQSGIQTNCGFRKGVHIEEFEYLPLTVRNFAGFLSFTLYK